MKLPVQITKFRGIKLNILDIVANWFDGYSISIMEISWYWKGPMCTLVSGKHLFYISFEEEREKGGSILMFSYGLLFFIGGKHKVKVLKEPTDCFNCGWECETKEYYMNSTPFCSPSCRSIYLDKHDPH